MKMFVHILLVSELFLHSLSHVSTYNRFTLFLPLQDGEFFLEKARETKRKKVIRMTTEGGELTNGVEIRTVE